MKITASLPVLCLALLFPVSGAAQDRILFGVYNWDVYDPGTLNCAKPAVSLRGPAVLFDPRANQALEQLVVSITRVVRKQCPQSTEVELVIGTARRVVPLIPATPPPPPPQPVPLQANGLPARYLPSIDSVKDIQAKCGILLTWLRRTEAENPPGEMGYRSPQWDVEIYRDEDFVALFGAPYDQTTDKWRMKTYQEVISPCLGARQHKWGKAQEAASQKFSKSFEPFFQLLAGSFSSARPETLKAVTAGRAARAWAESVVAEAASSAPTSESLALLSRRKSEFDANFPALWPSERRAVTMAVEKGSIRLASSRADTLIAETSAAGAQDLKSFSARWDMVAEFVGKIKDEADRDIALAKFDAALTSALEARVKELDGVPATLAGVRRVLALSRAFDKDAGVLRSRPPVVEARKKYSDLRMKLADQALPEWRAQVKRASSTEAVLQTTVVLAGLFPTGRERNTLSCQSYYDVLLQQARAVSPKGSGSTVLTSAGVGSSPAIGSNSDRVNLRGSSVQSPDVTIRTRGLPSAGQLMAAGAQAALTQLGSLIVAMGEERANNERELALLEESRQTFWRLFPDQPGVDEARQRYARSLLYRDLQQVLVTVSVGHYGSGRNDQILKDLVRRMYGVTNTLGFGGGIAPIGRPEHQKWTEAFVEAARRSGNREQAFRESSFQMAQYHQQRDKAEFLFANPNSPLVRSDTPPENYLAAFILGTRIADSAEAAAEYVNQLLREHDAATIARVVRIIRSSARIENNNSLEGDWGSYREAGRFLDKLLATGSISIPAICGNPETERIVSRLSSALEGARSSLKQFRLDAEIDALLELIDKAYTNRDLNTLTEAIRARNRILGRIDGARQGDLMLHSDSGIRIAYESLHLSLSLMDDFHKELMADKAVTR